jgi:hypothetical protein
MCKNSTYPHASDEPHPSFRRFHLYRHADETGVSGTGTVAEGIQYQDGHVSMRWCVKAARSTTIYTHTDDVTTIHGHDGKTEIIWID